MNRERLREMFEHVVAGTFVAALGGTLMSGFSALTALYRRPELNLTFARLFAGISLCRATVCVGMALCRRPPAREVIIMSVVLAAGNAGALGMFIYRSGEPFGHAAALIFTFAAVVVVLFRFVTGPSAGGASGGSG